MDCEKCSMPGCSNLYKMQSPAELARPENPTPKWPVPQDLIELQPSYAQVKPAHCGLFSTMFLNWKCFTLVCMDAPGRLLLVISCILQMVLVLL